MAKHRQWLMILVCLGLAGLVWIDDRDVLKSWWAQSMVSQAPKPASVIEAQKPAADKQRADAEPAGSNSEAQLIEGNPLASFDKASLQNWVDRPVFAPSRKRPPAKVAAKAELKKAPPPEYQLLGVVLNTERTTALLRSQNSGVDFRVQVGDMIGGWHVASVKRESVTLKHDDDTIQTVRFTKKACTADGTGCD